MAIIGTIASFSIRGLGIIVPQIFDNILLVKATMLIDTLFILSLLLFWLVLYLQYISSRKAALQITCVLAIMGSAAVSAIYVKKVSFIFGMNIHFPLFLANPYFNALAPLIGSVFYLIFFVSFKKSLELKEKPRLRYPVIVVILGLSFYIAFQLMVLFNFLTAAQFPWLAQLPRIVAVSFVPLILLAVSMLFFYFRFYALLNSGLKIRTGNKRS